MKLFVLSILFLFHASRALTAESSNIVASVKLIGRTTNDVQSFVSSNALMASPPEHIGKNSINYIQRDRDKEIQLTISLEDGKVSNVSWWFRGNVNNGVDLAKFQKAIATDLKASGFEDREPAFGFNGVTLFGDLLVAPGQNEAFVLSRLAQTGTRTLVELHLEIPLMGSAANSSFALWISISANADLDSNKAALH